MDAVSPPLRVARPEPGIVILTLARPRANVLDAPMIAALSAALAQHGSAPDVQAIVLGALGPSFSYGASIEEHRRDLAPRMLASIHALFRQALDLSVPLVAAVRGQCLGGGLELVLCASFVAAAPDARFGQPEIRLGVLAPFASVMLPLKLGLAHAERLLLSGASLDAAEARRIGLVDVVEEDPDAAALRICREQLCDKSASSLRLALRAARLTSRPRIEEALAAVERLYLDELMATSDANEGIKAFLEKRPPRWRHA